MGLEEECKRIGGRLEEDRRGIGVDWRRIEGGLEEEWSIFRSRNFKAFEKF